jgi:cellulose synthase/poly-beta-1,6-N-acetylglucosamine synthase-like glycosyltransferase
MNAVFWSLILLIFYAYCGYPLLLFVLSLFSFSAVRKAGIRPFITVIIAAHNEERNIRQKINETLKLDYPKDRLEVIVASDGSTDGTESVVRAVRDKRVRIIAFGERRGKTSVQNEAVKQSSGEVLVFSDATTVFDRGALKALAANFADPRVGAVGGELRYVNKSGSAAGQGGGFYWKYERAIKRLESRVNSLIGVSGCCYAVRRSLYEDIPHDLISDFVIAQLIYKKGRRTVYEPEAVSYEETNESFSDEFAMRVRVAVRTLHGLWRMRGLMNPLRYGFFSIQLLSHKILRDLIPVFFAAVLFVNIELLLERSAALMYAVILAFQLLFYGLVIAGWVMRGRRFASIPYYFFITNTALLVGFMRFLRGEKQVIWKPLRK